MQVHICICTYTCLHFIVEQFKLKIQHKSSEIIKRVVIVGYLHMCVPVCVRVCL